MNKHKYINWVFDNKLDLFLNDLFKIFEIRITESKFREILYNIKLLNEEGQIYDLDLNPQIEIIINFSRGLDGGILSFEINSNVDYSKSLENISTKYNN